MTVTPGADDEPVPRAGDESHDDGPGDVLGSVGDPVDAAGFVSGEPSDDEVDAAFAAIISGIAPHMRWSGGEHPSQFRRTSPSAASGSAVVDGGSTDPERGADPPPARPAGGAPDLRFGVPAPGRESAQERARRRELRRAERAAEVAAFQAEQAQKQAELAADDAHFTPPEPPPLPRLRGKTIGALAMIIAGIVLMARPGLLAIGADLVLVLALVLIVGGFGLLVAGMRRPGAGGPDGPNGWDDGAQV